MNPKLGDTVFVKFTVKEIHSGIYDNDKKETRLKLSHSSNKPVKRLPQVFNDPTAIPSLDTILWFDEGEIEGSIESSEIAEAKVKNRAAKSTDIAVNELRRIKAYLLSVLRK